jgi:hypothetical protein
MNIVIKSIRLIFLFYGHLLIGIVLVVQFKTKHQKWEIYLSRNNLKK